MIDLNRNILTINSNQKHENELKSDCVNEIKYNNNMNNLEMFLVKSIY